MAATRALPIAPTIPATLAAMQQTLEKAGVTFISDADGNPTGIHCPARLLALRRMGLSFTFEADFVAVQAAPKLSSNSNRSPDGCTAPGRTVFRKRSASANVTDRKRDGGLCPRTRLWTRVARV